MWTIQSLVIAVDGSVAGQSLLSEQEKCVVYVTANKTSQHSGTDATSSGVQSPDRISRAHSVAGRQPSYAQPTVASLLRVSRSNDLLDGGVAVPICPRCRPREFISVLHCFRFLVFLILCVLSTELVVTVETDSGLLYVVSALTLR